MFAVLIFCVPLGKIVLQAASFISPGAFNVKMNIDENLPSYFEALEKGDKEWMLKEETNLRRTYVTFALFF